MKTATTVARVGLGAMFLVFGLNFFFHFFAMPPQPGKAGEFAGALYGSGYLMHVTKGIEVVAGGLLLAGVLAPLALTLLAPVVVNIALFNVFLTEPSQWAIPALAVALEVYLIWAYREYFRGLLVVHARQSVGNVKETTAAAIPQPAH